ncbi:hypothetical protein KC331_g5152 [Hortaea werneckii]|uniref:Domain of unknown function at the cortex 1 domain-containing protein n=1 Tax=Hortaea werneckii TaxID=91943 RepID=A0A3M7CZS0_HORWE|nr:hypothetical protein KC331_g5152 [Hortaea werneckii]KAI7721244.1 hypothetical protein KC353_g1514 [Hortaea werneckii]RMY57450.1 hypothetical protein D0865_03118 [Hortaea werneckii]
MASAFRKRFSGPGNGNGNDPATQQEADKYKLKVTAGPSYDQSQHHDVPVNADDSVYIQNAFIRAKVKVRVREYRGLPSTSRQHSAYFDDPMHEKDLYSVAFSFVPKQDLPSIDTVWGNDFDHPVRDRLPPGFNTAFRIVKEFIDPGLNCDAYADEPWLYGPSLSCWFAFRIGDQIGSDSDFPAPTEEPAMREGGEGSGLDVRSKLSLPENNEKRRKHFLSASNREAFTFEKDRLYQADFYNPYIDFSNFSLKLPGFSLKVIKYVDQKSHCLRYVFKNVKTGDVFLNVNFHLLWGDKLKEEVEQDRRASQQGANTGTKTDGNGESREDTEGVNGDARHEDEEQQATEGASSTSASNRGNEGSGRGGSLPTTHPDNTSNASTNPRGDRASVDIGTVSRRPGEAQSGSSNRTGNQSQQSPTGVDEIAEMLGSTSTDDRRGSKALDE